MPKTETFEANQGRKRSWGRAVRCDSLTISIPVVSMPLRVVAFVLVAVCVMSCPLGVFAATFLHHWAVHVRCRLFGLQSCHEHRR